MTSILDLNDGKQAIISSDNRTDTIWLQLYANRGSLGVQLTKKQAVALRKALFEAVYQ